MKILFLGETYRADAQTWINGLKEFGKFEILTWELNFSGKKLEKLFRAFEAIIRISQVHRIAKRWKPELIVAERITSYGFIASTLHKIAPVIIAQQGITDIYPPGSPTVPIKLLMQRYAFRHAAVVHAWGEIMTYSMIQRGLDPVKIMVLAKGIDLRNYKFNSVVNNNIIRAVVTRGLTPDYRHSTIIKAFKLLNDRNIPFELIIIGDGFLKNKLEKLTCRLNLSDKITFKGRIPNSNVPEFLSGCDLYVSMPCTEGVSSSLFEAFASGCYPIVSDIPGNRAWIKEGINGSLVAIDDHEGLANSIENYYKNRNHLLDALLRNRKTVESKASYEMNMEKICMKYKEIVNKGKETCAASRG